MHIEQGGKRRLFTKTQMTMYAIGFGYIVVGWLRWPDESKQETLKLGWNVVARCIPW